MKQRIGAVTLVVKDYDEAIEFYTKKLNFILIEDIRLDDQKRWVMVAPSGASETSLLLAKAKSDDELNASGNQTGGRVAFFLHTDDFRRDHIRMKSSGVRFLEEPRVEAYGTVAVFEDLYGNKWDLIQLK